MGRNGSISTLCCLTTSTVLTDRGLHHAPWHVPDTLAICQVSLAFTISLQAPNPLLVLLTPVIHLSNPPTLVHHQPLRHLCPVSQ